MATFLNLLINHEEGKWSSQAGQNEPVWGWAVITLGPEEIARVELDYPSDAEICDALRHAAITWLRRSAGAASSKCPDDPIDMGRNELQYDVTAPRRMLQHLQPGASVERELTSFAEEKSLTTAVPCCGRRITLPIYETSQDWPAVCCRCQVVYRVSLHEEMTGYDDEPYRAAIFTVDDLGVAVARHRAGQ